MARLASGPVAQGSFDRGRFEYWWEQTGDDWRMVARASASTLKNMTPSGRRRMKGRQGGMAGNTVLTVNKQDNGMLGLVVVA